VEDLPERDRVRGPMTHQDTHRLPTDPVRSGSAAPEHLASNESRRGLNGARP
jgi:hypothetical protein